MLTEPEIEALCRPLAPYLPLPLVQALQTWAVARVQAAPPARQPDTAAAVATILALVPELVGPAARPDSEGVIDDPLVRLFKNLAWLAGQPAGRARRPLIARLNQARDRQDWPTAGAALLQILHAFDHPAADSRDG